MNRRVVRSLAAAAILGLIITSMPVSAATLQWGFDFTSGDVGTVDGGTVNNDGTGGADLDGQPRADRPTPVYSSDLPPAGLLQNNFGIGSVDVTGGSDTVENVGTVASLASDADVVAAGGITMEIWVKQVNHSGRGTMFSVGDAMNLEYRTDQDVDGNAGNDNAVRLLINSSGNPNPFAVVDNLLDDWTHLAGVFSTDGTDHTSSLYINGALVAETPGFPQIPVFDVVAGRKVTAGNATNFDFDFEGLVYEPRITMGVLSPSEFTIVPEPASSALLGLGMVGIACRRRRR